MINIQHFSCALTPTTTTIPTLALNQEGQLSVTSKIMYTKYWLIAKMIKPTLAQPKVGDVNWPVRHDLNSVEWVVKLQIKSKTSWNELHIDVTDSSGPRL